MAQIGFILGGRKVSFAEAIRWADEGTAPVPTEFIKALMSDRVDAFPSASGVGGCLRQFSLRKREDWYSPISDGLPALFGTAMHAWLEQFAPADVQTELRLAHNFHFTDLPAPYNEVTFGGTADYTDEGWAGGWGRIRDWKSKIYLPSGFYIAKAHKTQLNVYNALRVLNELRPMGDWEILYFDQARHPQYLRGPMSDPQKVIKWLRRTLHTWARLESTGDVMPPIPEFFEVNPKNGQPVAPCAYCNVRETCVALWNAQQENEVGTSDSVATGDSAHRGGSEDVADDDGGA